MSGEAEVRQFQVEFPEAEVAELRAYPSNLIHYNTLPKGGHFAAWDQPELFCAEMRASFKSLR